MKRFNQLWWMLCLGGIVGLTPTMSVSAQEAIAVIVHRDNPLSDLSIDGLRRIYLGSTTTFSNRHAVQLFESGDCRERFYKRVLDFTGERVKRHWIGLVFAGEANAPPREFDSAQALVQLVANSRGAIAFVGASAVDGTVKIVSINGKRLNDPTYPLR